MRKSLLAAISLVTASLTLFAASIGPAAADPASTASASAHGLSATGLAPISPTVTAAAALPPGGDTGQSPALLTVPLGSVAFSGTVGANASAHQADDIVPALTGVPTSTSSNPTTLSPVNARGVARTEGLALAFTPPAGAPIDPVLTALQALPGLLTAQAISAEAVARCVNNQPVFETGFQVAGLGGLAGGVLDPLVQAAVDAVLLLLPAGSALGDIISVTPGVVTQTATTVAIDGLVVEVLRVVPALSERIVISHAEATMPAGCGVAPPTTVAPARGTLAATGEDTPLLPIGAGLMGAAVLGYTVVRRSRRTAAQ